MDIRYYVALDEEDNELCVVSGSTLEDAESTMSSTMFSGVHNRVEQATKFGVYSKRGKLITVGYGIKKEAVLEKAKCHIFKDTPHYAEELE